jgi:hypothetical protein
MVIYCDILINCENPKSFFLLFFLIFVWPINIIFLNQVLDSPKIDML